MRSMPSISATYSISSAKSAISPSADRAAIGVDVLAEQRDFRTPWSASAGDFGQHVVERARDFLAARVRHDAEAAVLAAAFHDRDERRRRRRRALAAGGRTSRSRESRCRPAARRSRGARSSSSGRRCSVCGPNTRSTYGARSTIAAPSWLATQPPTPISSAGLARFRCAHAAEVGEHLLLRLLAHRAGVEQDHVGVLGARRSARSPRAARSTSAILSESYSFIWQPNVRM